VLHCRMPLSTALVIAWWPKASHDCRELLCRKARRSFWQSLVASGNPVLARCSTMRVSTYRQTLPRGCLR
jgi:hypothetical protein